MPIKIKEIQETNNPFYPLPKDYATLTESGQRQARVNASRLWMLCPDDPVRSSKLRVDSLHFFDQYYLHPDPEIDWDPGFYDQPPLPAPAFHWSMVGAWGSGYSVAAVAPRGSAKTTLLTKDTLLLLTTHPKYFVVYATSTHDNALSVGQALKSQAYYNQRIQDDFGPEYGRTTLAPLRSEKPTGVKFFYLNNLSRIRLLSAESKIRGVRPLKFRLDDIEHDPRASTPMEVLREYAERLIFKIALPTVLRANASLDMTGTFVSRRHYLWAAIQHILAEGRHDSRFSPALWRALIAVAAIPGPDGALVSQWPHMWPSNEAEKKRLHLPTTTRTILVVREALGPAVFNSEMMANPGTSEDSFFKLDTRPEGRHAWWLEGVDPERFKENPRSAPGEICWLDKNTLRRVPLATFFQQARLFMACDTAYTETSTSDRRVSHLMALGPDNVLFSFDLWSDRLPDSALMTQAFRMGERWKCPDIFVEVVRESLKLFVRMKSAVETRLTTDMSVAFTPSVHDLRPGTLAKTDKIAALDVRFDLGLVKMPLFLRNRHAPYTRLFEQIDSFNPISQDGGLQHDDELDTLAMSVPIIRGRLRRPVLTNGTEPLDPLKELREGRRTFAGGSFVACIPPDMLPADILNRYIRPPETDSSLLSTLESPSSRNPS
jgi:hypothetical protein